MHRTLSIVSTSAYLPASFRPSSPLPQSISFPNTPLKPLDGSYELSQPRATPTPSPCWIQTEICTSVLSSCHLATVTPSQMPQPFNMMNLYIILYQWFRSLELTTRSTSDCGLGLAGPDLQSTATICRGVCVPWFLITDVEAMPPNLLAADKFDTKDHFARNGFGTKCCSRGQCQTIRDWMGIAAFAFPLAL